MQLEESEAAVEMRRLFEEYVGPKRRTTVRAEVAAVVEPYLDDLRARTTPAHAAKVAAQVRRARAERPPRC